MRPARVKRLAVFLGTAWLAWAGIFAWMAGREAAVESPPTPAAGGAELFERHCASCHSLDAMRAAAGTPDDAPRRKEVEQFLDGHSEATADQNRQILDFLATGHAR